MSYFNKLSFASGYYHIRRDGVVELSENMPTEMKKRFWKVWPEFWAEMMKRAKEMNFSSAYPIWEYMGEDPNKAQYENL